MIHVTAAILEKNGTILIAQRPAEKSCGLLWEFPGGKQEKGESLEDCVRRECQEELGIQIAKPIPFAEVVLEDRGLHLHFFKTEQTGGILSPSEHAALCWIDASQIQDYVFCPSDTRMLAEADQNHLFESYSAFHRSLLQ